MIFYNIMVIHATELVMKNEYQLVMEYESKEAAAFPQITTIQQHCMQLKKQVFWYENKIALINELISIKFIKVHNSALTILS